MDLENPSSGSCEFFVQIVDEDSFIAVEEISLGIWPLDVLSQKIGYEVGDLTPDDFLFLDDEKKNRVEKLFKISLSRDGCDSIMFHWNPSEGLPYRTHSRRELILMKSGEKPLSVFTKMIPDNPETFLLPKHLFDPLVSSGDLVSRTYCEILETNSRFSGIEIILYASAREEWRIEAYMLVRSIARKMGWSEPLTRMEGSLLGYSEWQNDAFMAAGSS